MRQREFGDVASLYRAGVVGGEPSAERCRGPTVVGLEGVGFMKS
jgi:hypothetical protein